MSESGFVYVVHFERPYKHARHYLGWTRELKQRFYRHTSLAPIRRGSALMRAVVAAGIAFKVVRVWPDRTRYDERRKHGNGHSQRCPVCCGRVSFEDSPDLIHE